MLLMLQCHVLEPSSRTLDVTNACHSVWNGQGAAARNGGYNQMETRVASMGQARLASSVHHACRPRETADGSVRADEVGDWRNVLAQALSALYPAGTDEKRWVDGVLACKRGLGF